MPEKITPEQTAAILALRHLPQRTISRRLKLGKTTIVRVLKANPAPTLPQGVSEPLPSIESLPTAAEVADFDFDEAHGTEKFIANIANRARAMGDVAVALRAAAVVDGIQVRKAKLAPPPVVTPAENPYTLEASARGLDRLHKALDKLFAEKQAASKETAR